MHWMFYLPFGAALPFIFLLTLDFKADRAIGELSYPVYIVPGWVIGMTMGHLPGISRDALIASVTVA